MTDTYKDYAEAMVNVIGTDNPTNLLDNVIRTGTVILTAYQDMITEDEREVFKLLCGTTSDAVFDETIERFKAITMEKAKRATKEQNIELQLNSFDVFENKILKPAYEDFVRKNDELIKRSSVSFAYNRRQAFQLLTVSSLHQEYFMFYMMTGIAPMLAPVMSATTDALKTWVHHIFSVHLGYCASLKVHGPKVILEPVQLTMAFTSIANMRVITEALYTAKPTFEASTNKDAGLSFKLLMLPFSSMMALSLIQYSQTVTDNIFAKPLSGLPAQDIIVRSRELLTNFEDWVKTPSSEHGGLDIDKQMRENFIRKGYAI